MLREAIKKLEKEIESDPSNGYLKYVGDYLIDYLKNNPRHTENILKEGKTITGSFDFMKKVAQKKAVKGMVMLTPDEGFKAVLDYYGINEASNLHIVKSQKKIDISLDDLF